MSPREVTPPASKPAILSQESILNEYSVTSNGFLPAEAPLKCLSDPYYGPWEALMSILPEALDDMTLRPRVERLSLLSTDRLNSEVEWRRAYVILSFLTHAYIWGGDCPAEILPSSLSVPLLRVSSHLDLPPVATYAALNLWNFTTTDGTNDFTDVDSLRALHTFTGTEDESWFYVVSVAMEAHGASIIPVMLRALDAAASGEFAAVTEALTEFVACVHTLGGLLDRMHEKCDPMVFYHRIRPFLAGSKNMGRAGLPRGVFYPDEEGGGRWLQLRGGSNGQSSLVQFLDAVLGVVHTSLGDGRADDNRRGSGGAGGSEGLNGAKAMSFHEEVREYMPGPHRRFLEYVEKKGSLRNFFALAPKTHEEEKARDAFCQATDALAEFRGSHLRMVTRYIVIPSRTPAEYKGKGRVNLANAQRATIRDMNGDTGGEMGEELTGTGGTSLLPFLKQTRDETSRTGRLDC